MEIKIIAIFLFIIIQQVHCKQVLRQRRDGECQKCTDPTANFNSMAKCYETDSTRCCRVCEHGEYRDDTECTYNNGELAFGCSKCGKGTYQDSYNIDPNCKDCPSPSISCAENEMISQDCHKYYGDYNCVPIPTTASMANNATKKDRTTVQTPKPEKSAGGKNNGGVIAGAILGSFAVVIILLCVVYLWRFHRNHGHCNVFQTREILPSHVDGTQQNAAKDPKELQSLHGRSSLDSTDNTRSSQTPERELNPRERTPPDSPADNSRPSPTPDYPENTEVPQVTEENEMTPPSVADNSPLIQIQPEEIDDSDNYVLKENVEFWDFVIHAAKLLPQNTSDLHSVYSGLKLKPHDVQNEEGSCDNNVDKRLAVLRLWSERSRNTDPEKVCQLLSVMWEVKLGERRRDLIEKCCQKVASSV